MTLHCSHLLHLWQPIVLQRTIRLVLYTWTMHISKMCILLLVMFCESLPRVPEKCPCLEIHYGLFHRMFVFLKPPHTSRRTTSDVNLLVLANRIWVKRKSISMCSSSIIGEFVCIRLWTSASVSSSLVRRNCLSMLNKLWRLKVTSYHS